ncbi:MAG: transglycosylase SLT domain-containing protein [Polaromonas sp.]|nr:transglycosylase SLT domain-containing protein [Polaromonas sp.]
MLYKKNLTKRFSAVFSAALSLSLVASAPAQPAPSADTSAGDRLIVEMSQAFKRGDKARLTLLLPQARSHTLESWAAYWELKARLEQASTPEVQDFLARYAGSYQEDRLRNDWLLLLGQRRDWATFATEYPSFRMNDDPQVRCYALLAQSLQNPGPNPALAQEVRKNWHAQRDADDGCTAAAGQLAASQNLTPLDIWRKARLALEGNRTRAARDAVQIIAPEALDMVSQLSANPAKFLSDKYLAIRSVRKELITLALVKLASTDPESATAQLSNKWALQLTAEERNWVWGVIGRQVATRLGRQPAADAMYYFSKVSEDTDLTDDMLAWKTRAALRTTSQPQWSEVLKAINAMSEEARQNPSWVYWKARALLAGTPQQPEGLALLQSIASVRGFYEQLALEDLGQKITVPPRPAPLTAPEKDAALRNPGLNRAVYAIAIGLRPEGVREWNYSTSLHQKSSNSGNSGNSGERGMGERELLAAAQFACDRQIWDRCINTSERTKTVMDFEQRFPMPFRDTVVKRSQAINLDPSYVYGLMRQESRFVMDARSGVGASGLMQVMPATARWTAKKIGLSGFSPDQLSDRDTNITIGTAYLKIALDDLGGSMAMAAAAYNAGPSRPRAWRNGPALDAAIWAENVPFSETRDYVKKVLSNSSNYAAILTGQPQSLKSRLGRIGPRDAAAPPEENLP